MFEYHFFTIVFLGSTTTAQPTNLCIWWLYMLSACELRAPLCLSFLCKMERKKNIVFPSECSFMMYVNINFILSIVICSEYFEHFFMILFFLQLFLVCISNSKPFYHHSGIKTTQVLNRKFPSKSNFIQ